jgi:type II secretory ATPase GspE/PulE/Tfp pilus assembly ATPase PilB-like protein
LSGNILDEIEIIPEVKNSTEKKQDDIKQIIDINISSLEDIILYLQDKKYDFVTLEPEEIQIKITFRQDNVEREIKYIKFPVYTNILFKTKQITKLMLEDTGSSQE